MAGDVTSSVTRDEAVTILKPFVDDERIDAGSTEYEEYIKVYARDKSVNKSYIESDITSRGMLLKYNDRNDYRFELGHWDNIEENFKCWTTESNEQTILESDIGYGGTLKSRFKITNQMMNDLNSIDPGIPNPDDIIIVKPVAAHKNTGISKAVFILIALKACDICFWYGHNVAWYNSTLKVFHNGTQLDEIVIGDSPVAASKSFGPHTLKAGDKISVEYDVSTVGYIPTYISGEVFIDSIRIKEASVNNGGASMSKGIYLGVEPLNSMSIPNDSQLDKWFDVTRGEYTFSWDPDSWNTFAPTNVAVLNSTASLKITPMPLGTTIVRFECEYYLEFSEFIVRILDERGNVSKIITNLNDVGDGAIKWEGRVSEDEVVEFVYNTSDTKSRNAYCNLKIGLSYSSGSDPVARKVKNIYVGVNTEVPVYSTTSDSMLVPSNDNTNHVHALAKYFTIVHTGSYGFKNQLGNGNVSRWEAMNTSVDNSTASTTWTALNDYDISFEYKYITEANYDKFTIQVGSTYAINAVSGTRDWTKWEGSIKKGEQISLKYTKDGSSSASGECAWVGDVTIKGSTKQTGTTTKNLAHKVKKAYIGINGVARLCLCYTENT
ncbi:Uncharacterised protein [uncultured Eubacterium sp.]|nr:Uncharacterised protein [uncultured Eubacterium sp.]